jgi:hypothetical protein
MQLSLYEDKVPVPERNRDTACIGPTRNAHTPGSTPITIESSDIFGEIRTLPYRRNRW